MRILVSGATGLVGRFVIEHLLARGHDVVAGVRAVPDASLFSRHVETVPLALDAERHDPAFEDVEGLVHAAFQHVQGRYRGGEGDDPEGFRRTNLAGSIRLFEAARRMGVGRCVFLSSRAVYGPQPAGDALTEDMEPAPESLYGRIKLETENLLAAMNARGFATTSIRATGIYGIQPGRMHKWQAPCEDYLSGIAVTDRVGTELHGDDLASAVLLLLKQDPALVGGRVFNASDILTSHREILGELQQQTGCIHPLPPPADRSAFQSMDITRLRSLGWRPGGLPRLRDDIAALASRLSRS